MIPLAYLLLTICAVILCLMACDVIVTAWEMIAGVMEQKARWITKSNM